MPNDYSFVRVREGGFEKSISAAHAASAGLAPLNKPALDEHGKPLPALPVTDKAGQPDEDKPKATSPRRNARAATPKKAAEAVDTQEA